MLQPQSSTTNPAYPLYLYCCSFWCCIGEECGGAAGGESVASAATAAGTTNGSRSSSSRSAIGMELRQGRQLGVQLALFLLLQSLVIYRSPVLPSGCLTIAAAVQSTHYHHYTLGLYHSARIHSSRGLRATLEYSSGDTETGVMTLWIPNSPVPEQTPVSQPWDRPHPPPPY